MDKRKLIIKFYYNALKGRDDILYRTLPQFPYKKNYVSVSYSGIHLETKTIARDFVGYWKKISYNLAETYSEDVIDSRYKRVMNSEGYKNINSSINFINDKFRHVKAYKAVFQDSMKVPFSLVYLDYTWGAEDLFALESVDVFLEFIKRELSQEEELRIFRAEVVNISDKKLVDYGFPK